MKCPLCNIIMLKTFVQKQYFYNIDYYDYDCNNPECIIKNGRYNPPGLFFCYKDVNHITLYYDITLNINDIWYNLNSSNRQGIETNLYFVDMGDPQINFEPVILTLPFYLSLNDYEDLNEYESLVKRLLNIKVFS
ncbi:hypothetical protein UFOVP1290_127 [uncultured Caudovirales phage]|uniref:Uncharacterized protein n=1 Tax=uncultured Caudovirales phage TaxID=2100421 RepID=A0A6J5RQQ6_9CAUD|nr:hypothetical protein UFOVP1290_127 [uncultured Caudovirales phage]